MITVARYYSSHENKERHTREYIRQENKQNPFKFIIKHTCNYFFTKLLHIYVYILISFFEHFLCCIVLPQVFGTRWTESTAMVGSWETGRGFSSRGQSKDWSLASGRNLYNHTWFSTTLGHWIDKFDARSVSPWSILTKILSYLRCY